jgi:hypothetical protein
MRPVNRFLTVSAVILFMITSSCKKETLSSGGEDSRLDISLAKPGTGDPVVPVKFVEGLDELQGSTVGPDQALYVTAPLAGSIWRIDPKTGAVSLFATGLPARIPDPFFQGSGVVDVAFRGATAYALVTGVAPDLLGNDIVGIYRIDGANQHSIIADIGAWSEANPPATDIFIATGFQYAIEPWRDGFLVSDGHHNRVLYVTLDGVITEMITFSNVAPTGLAVRGNNIYVAEAGPIPHFPENAKLMSFSPSSSSITEVASAAGLNVGLFVDVEFGLGNTMYALAQGNWDGPFEGAPALPNTGALLELNANGGFNTIASGLNLPTSVEFIRNNAYIVSLAGEVWKIGNVSAPPFGRN